MNIKSNVIIPGITILGLGLILVWLMSYLDTNLKSAHAAEYNEFNMTSTQGITTVIDWTTFPDGSPIPNDIEIIDQFQPWGIVFIHPPGSPRVLDSLSGILISGGLTGFFGDIHMAFVDTGLGLPKAITIEIIGSGLDISASLEAFDSNDNSLGNLIHTYTGPTGQLSPFTFSAPAGNRIASAIYNGGLNPSAAASIGTLIIHYNSPPQVTNPGDQNNTEGDTVSLQIVATDPDGDSLGYSTLGLPPGLSINTSTGLISGVIDTGASASSPYDVTVSVDDGYAAPVQVMFTWTVESLMNYIYLPVTFRYCPNFFDDFSNPGSGWFVGEEEYAQYEYFDGEYRILTKDDQYIVFSGAPTCARKNYMVEVDARWVGTPGESYGILFGIIGDYEQYYIFDVNTDYQDYGLWYFDGKEFHTIVPITSSSEIKKGVESNHLKITRNGNQITLEVNGTVLGTWTDNRITGATYTGILSTPYIGNPISDARFDNFSVVQLDGRAVFSHIQNSSISANSGVIGLRETRYHR
jgi:hypothetical protein